MFARNEMTRGVLSVVLASFFWGTTGTAASLIPEVSPLAIGAFSMGVGGLFLIINTRKTLAHEHKQLLSQLTLLLVGGLSVAIYPLAFY
jgi:DME family drug/metabolite transporter